MKLSNNGVGIATLIVAVLYWLGVEVELDTINDAIAAALTLWALVKLIVNQATRPNVKRFFFKE
jgi:uncharacterized membrane protein